MKNIFGVPIYENIITLPDHEHNRIKNHILVNEKYCKKPDIWLCDLVTSYQVRTDLFAEDDFEFLASVLNTHANQFATEIDFDNKNYEIFMTSMWFNTYRKNQSQEKHDHGKSFLSCAFILDAPEGASDFMMYNPLKEGLLGYPTNKENNLLLKRIKAEKGKLIIFPGWLDHGVMLNQTNEPRISISCNWSIR